MDGSLIPIWITSSCSAVGVIYAITRNGQRGKKQDDQLKMELKAEIASIKMKLDDPNTGLGVIKKCVDDQKLHCVAVSTRIEGQVNVNKQEIANLRRRE